jgi:hypothetical protein
MDSPANSSLEFLVTRMLRCSLGLSLLWTTSNGFGISTACSSQQPQPSARTMVPCWDTLHSPSQPCACMLEQAALCATVRDGSMQQMANTCMSVVRKLAAVGSDQTRAAVLHRSSRQ